MSNFGCTPLQSKVRYFNDLKPGENKIMYDGKYFGIVELRLIPTLREGTCHCIQLSNQGASYQVDMIYTGSLSSIDVPKSFTIYFTAKNDWQAIIYNNNAVQKQPFSFDTSGRNFPMTGKSFSKATLFTQLIVNFETIFLTTFYILSPN